MCLLLSPLVLYFLFCCLLSCILVSIFFPFHFSPNSSSQCFPFTHGSQYGIHNEALCYVRSSRAVCPQLGDYIEIFCSSITVILLYVHIQQSSVMQGGVLGHYRFDYRSIKCPYAYRNLHLTVTHLGYRQANQLGGRKEAVFHETVERPHLHTY